MAECKHTGERATVAENPNKDDEQLTCGICIGRYRNPRYLPTCGHTFCENCLLTYARNIQQESQGSKITCPVCRKPNNLPEHDEVTLQWVQTFPLNTVIIKLMESLPQSSEEMKEERKLCDPCREEGETTAGLKFCFDCNEVLCKTCTKFHKKVKVYKDHKLIDITEMSSGTSRTDFFSGVGKCLEHPDRDVEIYCKSHDAVICFLCSTFQHTACDMTEITGHTIDVAKLEKDSEMLISQMKAAIEHLNVLQNLRMEVKGNLKQKLKKIRENIKEMRDQVVEVMDNVVSHVSDITKQIEIEREDRIDAEMVQVSKLKELTEQNVAMLDTIGQHGSEKHKFVSAHLVKKQYEETSKQISDVDRNVKQVDAELVIADNLKRLAESTNVETLVQIKVTESESNHTPLASVANPPGAIGTITNDLRDSKLVMAEEHAVCPDTGRDPSYYGVSVYRDGRVIISDYNHRGYLHLYNPANRTELKLMHDPYCAVQIDDTNLAVSTGEDKTISIVTVGNELRVEKTFQTQNEPRTIAALNNGQLAVAWGNPLAFSVIDISGTEIVQKSYLDQDTSGRKFEYFEYMAVDEMRQHVIQSCTKNKAVYCFDFTGNPVFKYTHPGLTNPRCTALDKCGNIYVCEYNSPGSIHKLSPAGDPISVIMEGVPAYPSAICSDVTGTGFWVTVHASDKVSYWRLEQTRES